MRDSGGKQDEGQKPCPAKMAEAHRHDVEGGGAHERLLGEGSGEREGSRDLG